MTANTQPTTAIRKRRRAAMLPVSAAPKTKPITQVKPRNPALTVIFFMMLLWWVWAEGPLAIAGLTEIFVATAAYVGSTLRATQQEILLIWALITVLKEGLQISLQLYWRWYLGSWSRTLLGMVVILLSLLVGIFDVGDTSTGFYVLFLPLDFRSIVWELAGVSIGVGAFGSIFAQVFAIHILQEWRKPE